MILDIITIKFVQVIGGSDTIYEILSLFFVFMFLFVFYKLTT